MKNTEPRHIRTGGDPRQFSDFTALRDEMSKQTHPARPDIHWDLVEQLSLILFEKNGVELQTGAWYTQARSHLARVGGMNEGLNIIAVMLSHQWAQFWPQSSHPRADILSGLFQRLQKVFRTFTLSHEDFPQLQRLESVLDSLSSTLARQELKQASQIEPLLQQVRSAVTRVENAPDPQLSTVAITLPPAYVPQIARQVIMHEPQLLYVIQQEPATHVEVTHMTPKRTGVFLSGMLTAFVMSATGFVGWYYLTLPDETGKMLERSLLPLPRVPDLAAIKEFKSNDKKDALAVNWLKKASVRLDELSALPPDWSLRYGQDLISQAYALWPGLSGTEQLGKQWQQKMALNGTPDDSLAGWHQGMLKLQNLREQLDALDGKKGKYLTVSELKSQVFAATQAFNKSVPVEEQLRQMSEAQTPGMIPEAQKLQAEQNLQQLITRYSVLTRNP